MTPVETAPRDRTVQGPVATPELPVVPSSRAIDVPKTGRSTIATDMQT